MEEPSIPQGLADKIHEPPFLEEGPNDTMLDDTMDTTVTLEDDSLFDGTEDEDE